MEISRMIKKVLVLDDFGGGDGIVEDSLGDVYEGIGGET
jgi:hypothetical protein